MMPVNAPTSPSPSASKNPDATAGGEERADDADGAAAAADGADGADGSVSDGAAAARSCLAKTMAARPTVKVRPRSPSVTGCGHVMTPSGSPSVWQPMAVKSFRVCANRTRPTSAGVGCSFPAEDVLPAP